MSESYIPLAIDLISGIFGGTAGVLAGHPLDTIKVRLQSGKYRGVGSCATNILRQEGVKGFYKGMASPLVGVAAINSLLFGAYGSALRLVSNSQEPNFIHIFIAGSASGFINGFFSCPMELIKIRLQNQTTVKTYSGPIDCVQQILARSGHKGLFRGLTVTLLRETPSYGAYFAAYDVLVKNLLPKDADPSEPSPQLLLAGGLAGVIGWLSTYPFDVIKTRIQSTDNPLTIRQCYHQIVSKEGYRVLWAGMGATALRAFPTNAATFYTVVSVQKYLYSLL